MFGLEFFKHSRDVVRSAICSAVRLRMKGGSLLSFESTSLGRSKIANVGSSTESEMSFGFRISSEAKRAYIDIIGPFCSYNSNFVYTFRDDKKHLRRTKNIMIFV